MAGTCARCGGKARLRRYCARCTKVTDDLRFQYVNAARSILASSGPLSGEWTELENWRLTVALDAEDSSLAVAPLANDWLTQFVDRSVEGCVGDAEISTFRRAAIALKAPASVTQPLDLRLYREFLLDRARGGDLPRAESTGLHLPTDELCYLNVHATRWRYLKSGARASPGQLVVTSRKVRFVAYEQGGEIPLGKVMSALDLDTWTLVLKASSGSLSGDYTVPDAAWAAAVIDGALRLDRRTVLNTSDGGSRSIPQHIKTEVWQRDRGCCVQCGATSYLEYDHIIPWSKGGASSVANVQILCRNCNLQKSDRI